MMSKKETVEKDKAKIQAVIAECGVKKIEALQKVHIYICVCVCVCVYMDR